MARFNLLVLFTVALASGFAAATPIAEVQDMTPNIQARSSFQYRFCASPDLITSTTR